ncbi:MAG: HlyD family secretion protein [Bacillota bacterium]
MNWRGGSGILVLIALLFAAAGCGGGSSTGTFTGTVEAAEVDVGAEIGGRVEAVSVQEGDRVEAGQVIVTMDTTILELQLEQARSAVDTYTAKLREAESGATPDEIAKAEAEVNSAKAALEGAEKALQASESHLKRTESLHEAAVVSDQELENARAEYDQKLAELNAAKAKLEASTANLKLTRSGVKEETLQVLRSNIAQGEKAVKIAQANLDKTRITAPVSGTAGSVNVERGEMVNTGASLVTIIDLNNLWVEVYVPEKYLDRVAVGDQALISITSVPDKEFKGQVIYIASEAEFTPENANTEEERADSVFKVRVKIMEAVDKFKPGMSAEVTFPRLAGE